MKNYIIKKSSKPLTLKNQFKIFFVICTVILSNLRRDRDLTDTLEADNSKIVSQKNLIWVQLKSPS